MFLWFTFERVCVCVCVVKERVRISPTARSPSPSSGFRSSALLLWFFVALLREPVIKKKMFNV